MASTLLRRPLVTSGLQAARYPSKPLGRPDAHPEGLTLRMQPRGL
jgi:hypothetical protein